MLLQAVVSLIVVCMVRCLDYGVSAPYCAELQVRFKHPTWGAREWLVADLSGSIACRSDPGQRQSLSQKPDAFSYLDSSGQPAPRYG